MCKYATGFHFVTKHKTSQLQNMTAHSKQTNLAAHTANVAPRHKISKEGLGGVTITS